MFINDYVDDEHTGISGIQQHQLDGSAWKCIDDLRAILARYAHDERP